MPAPAMPHQRAIQTKNLWLCRTPADQFFPEAEYLALEDALLEFSEQELGCRGISPLWLSYYVDGCRQVPWDCPCRLAQLMCT
jgi:hypothetical protein